MGKGSNVSKANKARLDAAKRKKAEGKGGGGAAGLASRRGDGAPQYTCAICRASFLGTANKAMLDTHVESRHAKSTFEQCFPTYGAAAGAGAPAPAPTGGKGKKK